MTCATFLVITDITFLPSSTSDMLCSGKCRQSWRALYSGGWLVCDLHASLPVCMLIYSCNVYGGSFFGRVLIPIVVIFVYIL
jgi:hypothetical protein